jgi:D-alanyl-D-alanine carboxypeptidase (penicillin-binding protein 5/6)
MTCVLTLEICKDFCIDKYATEVTVGRMETTVGGTTADLEEGQVYTIEQLLYGLMLPSGNDASVALAVWGGGHLL